MYKCSHDLMHNFSYKERCSECSEDPIEVSYSTCVGVTCQSSLLSRRRGLPEGVNVYAATCTEQL